MKPHIKKTKTKVKVNCIQCPNCKDIIYSRAHYDFHTCSCKGIFIDGGFEYTRIGGKYCNDIQLFTKFIQDATRQILYNDWNNRKDKYGIIHTIKMPYKGIKHEI